MRTDPINPETNILPPGANEAALIESIASSGYPLQGLVAHQLEPHFRVVEEWGFVDDESNQHRSLDLYAYKALEPPSEAARHTGLALFVECKRSRHPFVFFQQVVKRDAPGFPAIYGVPKKDIYIAGPKKNHGISRLPAAVLGLDTLPFVAQGPPICASFAKAIVSGSKAELSGSDGFNSIVLPLVKAFRYATGQRTAPRSTDAIYPTIALCIAVLDAPMMLVESPASAAHPVMSPWVRVVRHESRKERDSFPRSQFYTIDIIHSGFFHTYLEDHVLPFADAFRERAAASERVLRFGGSVPNLDNWTWDTIRPGSAPE